MSRLKRPAIAALAIVVAFAAILLAWTWWSSRPGVPPDVRIGPATVNDAASEGASTNPATVAALPPLPPSQAPIDIAAEDLLAHAESGNVRAACRLAFELLQCRELMQRDRFRGTQVPPKRSGNKEADDRALARFEEQMLKTAADALLCERVPVEIRNSAEELLARAARQGIPGAMFHYATGRHLSQDVGFAATPAFDTWLRDAPAMLHAARDAGVREAVAELAAAYSTDFGFPGALIPDDPVRAHAHRILGALLVEGLSTDLTDFSGRLSPDQVREARDLAVELHQRHFGGRRYPPVLPKPQDVPTPLPDPDSLCQPQA